MSLLVAVLLKKKKKKATINEVVYILKPHLYPDVVSQWDQSWIVLTWAAVLFSLHSCGNSLRTRMKDSREQQTGTKNNSESLHSFRPIKSTAVLPKYILFFSIFILKKINKICWFYISARPMEKGQRQQLRKEMQQELRGLLQKRMAVLLQVGSWFFFKFLNFLLMKFIDLGTQFAPMNEKMLKVPLH